MAAQALFCPVQANLASIAGFYAQMTGVLAGFAFTALVVLMTPTQVGERRHRVVGKGDSVILSLFAAFVSLLIATLTYSVLAGEKIPEEQAKASTLELIDGLPFGLAAIMLFHGVTLLIQGSTVERAAVWTARTMTVVIAPSIAYFYIASGAQDTVLARGAKGPVDCTALPAPGFILSLMLPAILVVSMIPSLQPASWRRVARKIRVAAPISVLLASAAASIIAGYVTTRSSDFVMSPVILQIYLVGTFSLFLSLSIILAYGYSAYKPDPNIQRGTSLQPTPASRSAIYLPYATVAGVAAAAGLAVLASRRIRRLSGGKRRAR